MLSLWLSLKHRGSRSFLILDRIYYFIAVEFRLTIKAYFFEYSDWNSLTPMKRIEKLPSSTVFEAMTSFKKAVMV